MLCPMLLLLIQRVEWVVAELMVAIWQTIGYMVRFRDWSSLLSIMQMMGASIS